MCLGIPAQVVALEAGHPDMVYADMSGARKRVNAALLADEGLAVGDWVAVHMGFVMEKLSREEADDALKALKTIGPAGGDDPWAQEGAAS